MAEEASQGIGLDSKGNPDPTANVRELVLAESKFQTAMREAQEKLLNEKVDGLKEIITLVSGSVVAFQNAQRDAETKRIDQLAETRQEFQNTIRDMLAESVRTTSNLVSTQLVQIQATFDTRVTKLEAGAFTQAGKSSVADPAMADSLNRMAAGIAAFQLTTTEAMNKTAIATAEAISKLTTNLTGVQSVESMGAGRGAGMRETNARLLAIVMAVAAVASPVIAILVVVLAMRGHPT